MIIEPPKTVEDFEKILSSILEMQGNPYCNHSIFIDLLDKEEQVRDKIEELKAECKKK
jgi:uncharacterized protein YozE (UPF0346 family)